ncbi:MAG TPA: hypothetical protein VGF45_09225 [Polyangia bacterium]
MDKAANRERLQKGLENLKTLRDEIRLDLHLAGMDLRDEWRALERRLPTASAAAAELKDATTEWLEELSADLRKFRDRLRERRDSPRP